VRTIQQIQTPPLLVGVADVRAPKFRRHILDSDLYFTGLSRVNMSGEGKAGGLFPWTMQRMFHLPVVATRSRDSLPAPPDGMDWCQNEDTKEWQLVKSNPASSEPDLVTEDKEQTSISVTPEAKHRSNSDQLPPRCGVVDRLPSTTDKSTKDDDWELLSDRLSSSSNQTPGATLHRNAVQGGSVRSLTSMEEHESIVETKNNTNTLSLPFKIQRTASSSTIDSSDNALGPSGKGILGVDYVEHVVLPTDTLQGICLAYKLSSTRLRQANHFSGNSLLLAPKKLVIPLSTKALRSGFIRVQDTDAKEYKLHAILAEFPDLSMTEAKA
jgi:LysM repeat protein